MNDNSPSHQESAPGRFSTRKSAWVRACQSGDSSRDTPFTRGTTAGLPEFISRVPALDRRGQEPRSTPPDGILYTKNVQAHWTETTVGKHGELVLETVPFEPGQPVEVLVVSKTAGSTSAGGRSLRDSVLEFHEPLEPVASEDWDALQ